MHITGEDSRHIDLNGNITGTRCLTFTTEPGQVVRPSDLCITNNRNVTTINTSFRDYYSSLNDCCLEGMPNFPGDEGGAWISEPSSPNINEEPESRPAESSGRDREKDGQFTKDAEREDGDHTERDRAFMAREIERAQEQAQRNSERAQRSRERAQRKSEQAQRKMYFGTYARQGQSTAGQQQFLSQMADFGQRMGELGRMMGEAGRQQGELMRNQVETQVAEAEAAGRYQDFNRGGQKWRRYDVPGGTIIRNSNSFRSCTTSGGITITYD